MPDPIAPSAANPLGLVLDPESQRRGPAALQSRLVDAAYALRHGRGDVSRAEDLLRAARLEQGRLDPARAAAVGEAARTLEAAIAQHDREHPEDRVVSPLRGPIRRPPSTSQRLERALRRELREVPEAPEAAQAIVARSIRMAGGGVLRELGRSSEAQMQALAGRAGAAPRERALFVSALRGHARVTFHEMTLEVAGQAIDRRIEQLEQARSGRGLARLSQALVEPSTRRAVLRGLEATGASGVAEDLRSSLEQLDAAPAAERGERLASIQSALAEGLSTSIAQLREHREGLATMVYDPHGRAYQVFPAAAERVARHLGVPPSRAAAMVRGHGQGGSMLEEIVRQHVVETREERHSAERMSAGILVLSAVVVSALTGGGAAGFFIGLAANMPGEAFEVASAYDQAALRGTAAEAGLGEFADFEAARDGARLTLGTAIAAPLFGQTLGSVGHGLGGATAGHALGEAGHLVGEVGVLGGRAIMHEAHRAHEREEPGAH